MCGLYLGGAAHADDVWAIASSATAAEQQSQIINDFAVCNGLKLNSNKTEVVRIAQSKSRGQHQLQLMHHSIDRLFALVTYGPTTCWLNQGWNRTSVRPGGSSLPSARPEVFLVIQTPSLPEKCLNNVSFPLLSMEQKIGFLTTAALSL